VKLQQKGQTLATVEVFKKTCNKCLLLLKLPTSFLWLCASLLCCPFREEREAIEFYFHRGHAYMMILLFLSLYHGISMSMRTLKRRLLTYGLARRRRHSSLAVIWRAIHSELEGPGKYGLVVIERL